MTVMMMMEEEEKEAVMTIMYNIFIAANDKGILILLGSDHKLCNHESSMVTHGVNCISPLDYKCDINSKIYMTGSLCYRKVRFINSSWYFLLSRGRITSFLAEKLFLKIEWIEFSFSLTFQSCTSIW